MSLTGQPAVIINVDDNEPALYARSRILEKAGHIVHSAASGRETLDFVTKYEPDLLLLDVHLPDVNGIELCRQIKNAYSSICILQISASATGTVHATAALNNGADAYLTEPVDADVLLATVRALLRLRQAERALASANEDLATINQELIRSNEELSQFAYVASHDLQEPLRTITIYGQLLQQELASDCTAEQKKYFEFVISGAHRMSRLISALLTYSQIRNTSWSTEKVDMGLVVSGAVSNLDDQIRSSGAEVVVHESLPAVKGEASQLIRLMQNLFVNAIKYAKPGVAPKIEVMGEKVTAGSSVFRVTDNGVGIAPQYHDLIFAPFKRLHGSDVPGAGIGLAVCRRIMEAHGGSISVESEAGEGSTFVLRFSSSKLQ